MTDGGEQRAQDPGLAALELLPQLGFQLAFVVGNRRERLDDAAVGEIGPGYDVVDAVEDDRAASNRTGLRHRPYRAAASRTRLPVASRQYASDSQSGRPLALSFASTWLLRAAM
jgi:hypothetical protein